MSGYNTVLARNTENAPKSSLSTQSVAFSHYNHLSAQLPLDPKTGKMVAGGVKEQAEQCLKNMKAIVESVAHVMDDVVAVTVFLKDSAAYGCFSPDRCSCIKRRRNTTSSVTGIYLQMHELSKVLIHCVDAYLNYKEPSQIKN